jgi:hypothetical protein
MKTLLRTLFILLLMIGIIIAGLFSREHKIVVKKQIDIPRTIVFGLVNDFTIGKIGRPGCLMINKWRLLQE